MDQTENYFVIINNSTEENCSITAAINSFIDYSIFIFIS